MDAERLLIIEALRGGKGNSLLNQKVFRVAKNLSLSIASRHEAEEQLEQYEEDKHIFKLRAGVWRDYSSSISSAPNNSKNQALGYAGRSLILFHLNKYKESIRDIERALKITEDNGDKVELFARKALCHAKLNQPEKTIALEKAEFYLKKLANTDKRKLPLNRSVNLTKNEIVKIQPKEQDETKAKIINMLKKKETKNPFNNVDIRYDEKYGRHLIAKQNFKAGEIVCVQKPFAMCSNTDFLPFAYCCHCLCISWDSVPCLSCGWALFCSEKCRDEAYEQYHDIECVVMPRVRDMQVADIFKQLTIRTLILAVREYGGLSKLRDEIEKIDNSCDKRTKGFSGDKFDGSQFRSVYSLAHNVSEENLPIHINESIKVLFAFINCTSFFGQKTYKTISHLLKDEDMLFIGSLILRLIKIFNINYHGIFEDNILCENGHQREICTQVHCCYRGMMITPLFALINHSCIPNAMFDLTDASNVVLFATRPIKKDEQIFISYGQNYYFNEKFKRKVNLQRNYNFTCDCKACLENWPTSKEMDQEQENKLPNVKKQHKIKTKQLDGIEDLLHATIHKETHCLEQIKELGKAFSKVIKNFTEPSFLICTLMNAIERVSHSVYLTELITEITSIEHSD